jgi:hypothetical protein
MDDWQNGGVKFWVMRRRNDILWTGILERVFDDFLRFVFPSADQLFDMKRGFGFLDKELVEMYPEPGKDTHTRFVDKLVKVFRRDGKEEWMLIHIEVQGETKAADRPLFGERMFRYFYRIYDRYRKPVTAIAIFTGTDGHRMPRKFESECLQTRVIYEYNTLCLQDYPDQRLLDLQNPFALVLLVARQMLLKGRDLDERLLKGKLFVFRELYRRGLLEKQKLRAVFTFLNNYIVFEKPQTNRIFINEVEKITEKKESMDIFEQVAEMQRQEIVEKATRRIVRNLLRQSDLTLEKIASVSNVSVDFVKKVKRGLHIRRK